MQPTAFRSARLGVDLQGSRWCGLDRFPEAARARFQPARYARPHEVRQSGRLLAELRDSRMPAGCASASLDLLIAFPTSAGTEHVSDSDSNGEARLEFHDDRILRVRRFRPTGVISCHRRE